MPESLSVLVIILVDIGKFSGNSCRSQGLTMDNVVKTTVFLTDLNDFQVMNGIYGDYFKGETPARATIQVTRLPKEVMVEIDAIAVV